ncbi:MAG: tRNA (N(6)-L-threonylcarbamoyladenosine(37)-C(2))-methylthiotransferase MtaB, partial [Porcipelethomonas sp.]
MKVYLTSFGCKVNQYETESISADFLSRGFEQAENPEEADVIVINSCTVTASGDSKSVHFLRKVRKLNEKAIIVLTGCMPQASPDTAEKISEADIVTGTKERGRIPQLVLEFMESRSRIVNIKEYSRDDEYEEVVCGSFSDRTRAFVKIQDGCNQFCTYCIIPYARGRCRSKPLEHLKKEAETLAESGIKEIVLVGINLMFYGSDIGLRLIDAVEACCEIKGIERVRLGSLEPEMISDEDLLRLSEQKKFCPQFHLSLQSGCDKTLRQMNRHYSTHEYYDLVQKIRTIFPDCSVTTDIMVGFPGETDGDFMESLEFAEKVGFSKIHVFQYSSRKGTAAAKMPQVSEQKKNERAKKMKEAAARLHKKHLEKQEGRVYPVLFERESTPDFHQGYTPNYTLVKIPAKK